MHRRRTIGDSNFLLISSYKNYQHDL
jgi:hypothetical protein